MTSAFRPRNTWCGVWSRRPGKRAHGGDPNLPAHGGSPTTRETEKTLLSSKPNTRDSRLGPEISPIVPTHRIAPAVRPETK